MPRHRRNSNIITLTSTNSKDAFTRLCMEDLQSITSAAGLVTGTTDESSVETPADATNGTAVVTRDGPSADPVRCIPEGNEGVAASDSKIAASWR